MVIGAVLVVSVKYIGVNGEGEISGEDFGGIITTKFLLRVTESPLADPGPDPPAIERPQISRIYDAQYRGTPTFSTNHQTWISASHLSDLCAVFSFKVFSYSSYFVPSSGSRPPPITYNPVLCVPPSSVCVRTPPPATFAR